MFWPKKKKTTATPKAAKKIVGESKSLPLSYLKRLIPIGRLADDELKKLRVTLSHYKAGETIFTQSESSDSLSYIVKGQCFLETNSGSGYDIDAKTFKSCYPLSSHVNRQCTAIAKTDVSVIHFPQQTLHHSSNSDSRNPLVKIADIPEKLQKNYFYRRFCQHFKEHKLFIPSLPDVSLKLRQAMQKNIGVDEAVKIISLDPVISSKLIQIVNSPLYRDTKQISNCHDAVARLGLTQTRNLVTSISLQNLFKSQDKELNQLSLALWKQSVHVSCISYTLASQTGKANPDEALLAGLIHNIGAIPVIIFADSLEDKNYSPQDLNLSIQTLQGLLGNYILEQWEFPKLFRHIPRDSENWYHNKSETLDLSDIVLLARFHSYIDSQQMKKIPPIHTLPAFVKLGDHSLTPEMSLQTLHDARQQIHEAMSLFRG